MIKISFLADHPDVMPTLAQWFRAQWPDYYADQTLADMEEDFREDAQYDSIPLRLVAFLDGELAGTIVLREQVIETQPQFHPGLGGLFVPVNFRQRGIATELVRAGMHVARAQGYREVYATTAVAGGILKRLGWVAVEAVEHDGEHLTLYRCDLGTALHAANDHLEL